LIQMYARAWYSCDYEEALGIETKSTNKRTTDNTPMIWAYVGATTEVLSDAVSPQCQLR
jgi:hypothetical protein